MPDQFEGEDLWYDTKVDKKFDEELRNEMKRRVKYRVDGQWCCFSVHNAMKLYAIQINGDLCLTEKLTILTADQNSMLNKRNELLEACRRWRKHLLVSLIKPPDEEEPPDTTIK